MARLNDAPAPPPAESIEALKRRFIRQNREIARVNSQQSMRIRNLETEISRLLAENIAIREQAIAAETEATRLRGAQRLAREVYALKERLEEKLGEVNALVDDLGGLPDKVARRSSVKNVRRRSGLLSDLVSNFEDENEDNRTRKPIRDQQVHDGQLPPIVEGKSYPRRTLDTTEVKLMIEESADSLESPEIGPPPVVHFDVPEIPEVDGGSRCDSSATNNSDSGQTKVNKTNFEARRKRRTSALLSLPSDTVPEASQEEQERCKPATQGQLGSVHQPAATEPAKRSELQKPLKIGAKRKLGLSELEDASGTRSVNKELDDFIFQRKTAAAAAATATKPSRFTRAPSRQDETTNAATEPASPTKHDLPPRRILAPKSTNSPAKRKLSTASEKPNLEKGPVDIIKVNIDTTRARTSERPTMKPPTRQHQHIDEQEDENKHFMPPETPAPELEDMCSPLATSTDPPLKTRHVQEAAVTNSVEDVLNRSIGRGSRRAKAAVSYAEPNLRDKMRRPGGRVGAVEGFVKSSSDRDLDPSRVSSVGPVDIKEDPESVASKALGWQNLPAAVAAEEKEEAASPLRGKRSHVKINDHQLPNKEARSLHEAISQLSVYDHPTSSPASKDTEAQPIEPPRPVSRTRRHSVQPQSTISATTTNAGQPRRPSSALSLHSDQEAETKPGVRRSSSVSTLSHSRNNAISGAPGVTRRAAAPATTTATGVAGVSSRRRSMMV